MGQGFDEDVEEKYLGEEGGDVVADEGEEG